jgi:hypothetical protein
MPGGPSHGERSAGPALRSCVTFGPAGVLARPTWKPRWARDGRPPRAGKAARLECEPCATFCSRVGAWDHPQGLLRSRTQPIRSMPGGDTGTPGCVRKAQARVPVPPRGNGACADACWRRLKGVRRACSRGGRRAGRRSVYSRRCEAGGKRPIGIADSKGRESAPASP